jgi:hypothetical protein
MDEDYPNPESVGTPTNEVDNRYCPKDPRPPRKREEKERSHRENAL